MQAPRLSELQAKFQAELEAKDRELHAVKKEQETEAEKHATKLQHQRELADMQLKVQAAEKDAEIRVAKQQAAMEAAERDRTDKRSSKQEDLSLQREKNTEHWLHLAGQVRAAKSRKSRLEGSGQPLPGQPTDYRL